MNKKENVVAKGKCEDSEKELERRRKISESRLARKQATGSLNSPETRQKMSEAATGRTWTEEQREKIVTAKRGRTPKNFAEFQAKGHATPKLSGPDNPSWKGDDVGYYALHAWVKRKLGSPKKCSRCGTEKAKRYEWANISREYKRDVTDWVRLCVSCHRQEGYDLGEYHAWNKGKRVQTNTGRTHVKKGQRISKGTEFKPGQAPHNKHLEPIACATCGAMFQPKEAVRKYCQRTCYWASLRKVAVHIKET